MRNYVKRALTEMYPTGELVLITRVECYIGTEWDDDTQMYQPEMVELTIPLYRTILSVG